MKKLILSLALACATLGAYANNWSTIRFGTDPNYPPFEVKGPDGKVSGFDVDLGNEICRRLNAACVWVENSFDGMIPALRSRKFDGVLSSMTMTPARAQVISFSEKIYNTPTRLVVRKGSGVISDANGVRNKRIGVDQGSIQEAFAKANWAPVGATIVPYQNQELVYQDLISGRLDGALTDAVQAEIGFLKRPRGANFQFADGYVSDPKTLGDGAGIGLRKEDTDLKAKIDKAISDMRKDGTYDRIAKKYFSFDVYGK
ncbi:ABC transporter substrate-binding protein [Burkholderia anthina]|uniref:ABC transporter substrate-binding protein n=1 Tax=Burkholderia anthina TaxID=179879 RepID=A0A6P2G6I0_9BURK|nr:ABC transporter substrate-binding protein [Burkholderia anthina]MBM2767548.1 ABC transporter substrate-binding protein [Burkholderia anthina]VVU49177.1 ABC transporter substrate-binding protein [Burkholderia anthina]